MTRNIEIAPGIIEINDAEIILDTPHCVFVEIDCVQKHPVIIAQDCTSIFIGADEGTLNVKDPSARPTEISVIGLEGGYFWNTVVQVSRYMIHLVVVRPNEGHDPNLYEYSEGEVEND